MAELLAWWWAVLLAAIPVVIGVLKYLREGKDAAMPREPTVEARVDRRDGRRCVLMVDVTNNHHRRIEVDVKLRRPPGMNLLLGSAAVPIESRRYRFGLRRFESSELEFHCRLAPGTETEPVLLSVWWQEKPLWLLRRRPLRRVLVEALPPQ